MRNIESYYRTDETFTQEFDFLRHFNPYALDDKCKSFDQILPDGFLQTIPNETNLIGTISPVSYHFDIQLINSTKLLNLKNYDFNNLLHVLENIGKTDWDESVTNQLMIQFGSEAFGMYLPFHNYHNCRWGIYLFPEIIIGHAHSLFDFFKSENYSFNEILIMYFFAVYRHELFHYQTERYATKLELITHQPHYRSLDIIREQVKNSEDWLEEALAEATVLDSLLLANRSHMSMDRIRRVYKHDLERMPSGYRDYKCNKYKGHHQAHLHFASQIKEMKTIPGFKLPELFTIKGEFASNDFSVPLYFVTGFNKITRQR
jgi:hypothetical protein